MKKLIASYVLIFLLFTAKEALAQIQQLKSLYAVTEKKKQYIEGYEPTVSVSTKKFAEKVEIRVKDNGRGIPQKVVYKIYQPFLTTKPSGQGTGLGLSLAYDIITKEHGGQLSVVTKEGEDAEFVIELPIR